MKVLELVKNERCCVVFVGFGRMDGARGEGKRFSQVLLVNDPDGPHTDKDHEKARQRSQLIN